MSDPFRVGYKKVICVVSGLTALISGFAYAAIANGLLARPRQPDHFAGLTVPFHTKNVTVYVTQADYQAATWTFYFAIASVATVILCKFVEVYGTRGATGPTDSSQIRDLHPGFVMGLAAVVTAIVAAAIFIEG